MLFRRRREKVFGPARGIPLDRNAKVRIIAYARAWSARHKQTGQHKGPLTRAILEVLQAMLWSFHNSGTGKCFPSYEAIAEKAGCCRTTVYRAIQMLETADVLTWVNRLVREQTRERDLFGKWVHGWRTVRTSNAYVFRDPLPCAEGRPLPESKNPPGTQNQDFSSSKTETAKPADNLLPLGSGLQMALQSLKATLQQNGPSPAREATAAP